MQPPAAPTISASQVIIQVTFHNAPNWTKRGGENESSPAPLINRNHSGVGGPPPQGDHVHLSFPTMQHALVERMKRAPSTRVGTPSVASRRELGGPSAAGVVVAPQSNSSAPAPLPLLHDIPSVVLRISVTTTVREVIVAALERFVQQCMQADAIQGPYDGPAWYPLSLLVDDFALFPTTGTGIFPDIRRRVLPNGTMVGQGPLGPWNEPLLKLPGVAFPYTFAVVGTPPGLYGSSQPWTAVLLEVPDGEGGEAEALSHLQLPKDSGPKLCETKVWVAAQQASLFIPSQTAVTAAGKNFRSKLPALEELRALVMRQRQRAISSVAPSIATTTPPMPGSSVGGGGAMPKPSFATLPPPPIPPPSNCCKRSSIAASPETKRATSTLQPVLSASAASATTTRAPLSCHVEVAALFAAEVNQLRPSPQSTVWDEAATSGGGGAVIGGAGARHRPPQGVTLGESSSSLVSEAGMSILTELVMNELGLTVMDIGRYSDAGGMRSAAAVPRTRATGMLLGTELREARRKEGVSTRDMHREAQEVLSRVSCAAAIQTIAEEAAEKEQKQAEARTRTSLQAAQDRDAYLTGRQVAALRFEKKQTKLSSAAVASTVGSPSTHPPPSASLLLQPSAGAQPTAMTATAKQSAATRSSGSHYPAAASVASNGPIVGPYLAALRAGPLASAATLQTRLRREALFTAAVSGLDGAMSDEAARQAGEIAAAMALRDAGRSALEEGNLVKQREDAKRETVAVRRIDREVERRLVAKATTRMTSASTTS